MEIYLVCPRFPSLSHPGPPPGHYLPLRHLLNPLVIEPPIQQALHRRSPKWLVLSAKQISNISIEEWPLSGRIKLIVYFLTTSNHVADADVVDTVADLKIQKLLIYGFKCFLTSLKLVDKEKEVSHQMSFTRGKLNCETYEQHSLMPKWQSLELTTSWNILQYFVNNGQMIE